MFFKYYVITQVLSMTFKETQNPPNLMVIVLLALKIKLFSYIKWSSDRWFTWLSWWFFLTLSYKAYNKNKTMYIRHEARTAATSKIERFVIIVNGWKPLTIITKCFILHVAAALDPPLHISQDDAILYCKFRQLCFIKNQNKPCYKLGKLSYYK